MGITQNSGFNESLVKPVTQTGRFTTIDAETGQITHLSGGTLRLTAFLPDLGDKPVGLIGFGRDWQGPGGLFGLWVSPGGALMLRHQDAALAVQWQSADGLVAPGQNIALSYQVWTDLDLAILRVEVVETGKTLTHRIEKTPALPLITGWSDLADVFVHAEVSSVPLSPSGVNAFAPGTALPTQRGAIAIEKLRPGDVILAQDGPVAILDTRPTPVLPSVAARLVCLRAPFLGLKDDLCLLPDQRIVLDAPEVESQLGCPAALVAAGDLGHPGLKGPRPEPDHLIQISLPRCVTLGFGGCVVSVPACPQVSHTGVLDYLPGPGALPWASASETKALLEPIARRRGLRAGPAAATA